MAQSPITEEGPIADAVVYTVPGSGPIKPLSCYAEFDAAGAAGPFIPVLLIKSQDGSPISYTAGDRIVLPGEYVEATWAPFLRAATAGAGNTATLPYAYTQSPFTSIPSALGGTTIPTQNLITDDSSLYKITTAGGNQGLNIGAVGHYLAFTSAICLALGGTQTADVRVASALVNKGDFLYGTADAMIYGKTSFIEMWEVTPADLTDCVRFTVENQTGVARTVAGYRVVVQLDTIDPSGDPF